MEDVETERDDVESSGQTIHQSEHLMSFDMENDDQHQHDIYYCPTSELEVIVPSFSLFHYDTDHSYISTTPPETLVIENPYIQSNKNDCISSTSGLALPELFDLYPYDIRVQEQNNHEIEMGIGLQEQVIEISQNTTSDYEVVRNSCEKYPSSSCKYNDSKKIRGKITEESPLGIICNFEETEEDEECPSESEVEQQQVKIQKNNCSSNKEKNKSNNNNEMVHKPGSQNYNHHVGQFPQTYIHLTSERRLRFCFGLQTIVTKVKALITRTGASADLRVWFEGHVFTLDNVEVKLYELSNKSNKKAGFVCSSSTIIPTTINNSKATIINEQMIRSDSKSNSSKNLINGNQEVEDDHRYAATILTQTESSQSVRDHQYNGVSTPNNNTVEKSVAKMNKGTLVEKTYIKTRYARERWLRNSIKTLYSKMQRLINRTGARMTLCVKYQGIMITQKNYKDLETNLGKSRPKLKKYPTTTVIEKQSDTNTDIASSRLKIARNQDSEIREIVSKTSTKENPEHESFMRISIPGTNNQKQIAMNSSNKSLKIEFLKINKTVSGFSNNSNDLDDLDKSNNFSKEKVSDPFLKSVITSDHDYLECTHNESKNKNNINSKSFSGTPSNSFKGNSKETDFNNLSCQMTPSLSFCHAITSTSVVNSNTEEILSHNNNNNDNLNTSLVSTKNIKVNTDNNIPSKHETVAMNVDACQLCGGKNIVKEGCIEKYPLWIRCSHPLCGFLYHPSCMGFLVMNSQQLQFLPPFFCPAHRSNIVIID